MISRRSTEISRHAPTKILAASVPQPPVPHEHPGFGCSGIVGEPHLWGHRMVWGVRGSHRVNRRPRHLIATLDNRERQGDLRVGVRRETALWPPVQMWTDIVLQK